MGAVLKDGAVIEALRAEAALDATAAAPGAPPPAPGREVTASQRSSAATVRGAVVMLVGMGEAKFTGIKEIYPEPVIDSLSATAGAVLDKYNVVLPDWMEKWKEEIALAILLGPLLKATGDLIKASKQKAPPGQSQAGPVSEIVAPPPPTPSEKPDVILQWGS